MKKQVPLLITFLVGSFMVVEYFITAPGIGALREGLYNSAVAIMALTMFLGTLNLVEINIPIIVRRRADWPYKIVLLGSLFATIGAGAWGAIAAHTTGGNVIASEDTGPLKYSYDYFYLPLAGTMFALLAFYIASAAFRAFRARSTEAALLLIAGTLVMLGRVPIGAQISEKLPLVSDWVMQVPNLAGKRAVLIGAALGAISTGLRVILGLERSYLGGD